MDSEWRDLISHACEPAIGDGDGWMLEPPDTWWHLVEVDSLGVLGFTICG